MRVNTPHQLLNLVAVVVVTSATFTQHAPAQELFHGGEVILSTDHYLHYVQARADTVCVYATEYSAKVRPKLFQLHVDGSTWDSIEVFGYEGWDDAPGTSAMVGFENHFDTVLKQTVGTVWIARSIDDVRIINVGRQGDLAPGHEIHDVVAHHYNPNVVIVTTFPKNWKYQTAHITTDGGLTWKKFLPASTEHFHYGAFFFGFDARNPQRIHIGFERENPNDPFYDGYNSAYSDDWCETLIDTAINIDGRAQDYRIPNSEKGLGIWSGAGGLSYFDPTFDRGPQYWHLTSDSLFLEPGEQPRRVKLEWLENARKSLLPSFDSTSEKFAAISGPVGFHSGRPNLIVLQFTHRYQTDSVADSVSLVAMSVDFGGTWSLLAALPQGNSRIGKPFDFHSLDQVAIDPIGPDIYIGYRHTKYDSLTGQFAGSAHTARWRNVPTGVGTSESSKDEASDFIVTPNPVAGNATLRLNFLQPILSDALVRIFGANGELVYTLAEIVRAARSMDVTLPGLSQGVYYIVLSDYTTTRSAKFVVLE